MLWLSAMYCQYFCGYQTDISAIMSGISLMYGMHEGTESVAMFLDEFVQLNSLVLQIE